jgi:hypothetical protein
VTHMYYKQRKEDLTEWMQVGFSKKNEDDDDLEDPLEQQEQQSVEEDDCISFHSCDSEGMMKKKKNPPPPPLFPEETTNGFHLERKPKSSKPSLAGPRKSSLSKRFRRTVSASLETISRKSKSKKQQMDMVNRNRWAAERDLDPTSFDRVRKLDQLSFRVFAISYFLFVATMFATLPFWRDDYQVNL